MSAIASEIAKEWAAAQGMGTIDYPLKFKGQDYEKLKAECLASGTLFEDPEFPAVDSSVGVNNSGKDAKVEKDVEWKRPKEICEDPAFIREGASREDIRQGQLGDCWFLASVASLTMNQDYLKRVLPRGQYFRSDYAGIFHFKVWRYGDWYDVVVDDRLPTKNENLLFSRTKTSEFWACLLEKAYAKLLGCYEALISGQSIESMTDFTGGVGEIILIKEEDENLELLEKIKKTFNENSFITAGTRGEEEEEKEKEKKKPQVIVRHMYTITGLEEVDYEGGKVQLIRLRNPWGSTEGKGSWSDNSPEWDKINQKVKEKLHSERNDGEFWMSYSDFLTEFSTVQICNLSISQIFSGESSQWRFKQFHGRWTSGSNAGGKLDSEIFWTNPKFKIKLQEPDTVGGDQCTLLVALMQKGQRRKKPFGGKFFKIGFYIYKDSGEEKMGKEYFKNNKPVGKLILFWEVREISREFKLPPGEYVIIPVTKEPKEEVDFFLRIFTKKPFEAQEVDQDVKADQFEPNVTTSGEKEPEFKDLDENGEYNEEEVKKFLDSWVAKKYADIKFGGFGMELIWAMIRLVDLDNTKTLSTEELKTLWLKVKHYIDIFLSVDADKTGTIDAHELQNALAGAGFAVDDKAQELLVQRFINKDNLTLSFDAFLSCMIQLETLFKMFQILTPANSMDVSFSLEEWVRVGLA